MPAVRVELAEAAVRVMSRREGDKDRHDLEVADVLAHLRNPDGRLSGSRSTQSQRHCF